MAVNVLNFNQVSTLLRSIASQATGKTVLAPLTTSEFVTVGQTTLLAGTDNVINAISQVLSRTIFSVRPYNAHFKGMRVTEEMFGAITRKLVSIDNALEDDDRFALVDGSSVDMFVVKKPTALQLNFYGFNVYQQSVTVFRDQLNVAFEGPSQFGEFISMVMQNVSDQLEQADEELSRECLNNMIMGRFASDSAGITHCTYDVLAAYNTATGKSLTSTTVFDPANFRDFARWTYGFINTFSDKMTFRSYLYHTNLTGYDIPRHTPKERQRLYVNSDLMNTIKANVLSTTYNEFLLSLGDYESVGFWQSIDSPMAVKGYPSYLKADGTIKEMNSTNDSADVVDKPLVLAVLADVEAFGTVNMNEWMSPTPFNARGGYYNLFWHQEKRYWNDCTENCIIFYIGEGGGGGGGAKTASVVIDNQSSNNVSIQGAFLETIGDDQYVLPGIEVATGNSYTSTVVVTGDGTGVIIDLTGLEVTVSGDISDVGGGTYIITGDGTITITDPNT